MRRLTLAVSSAVALFAACHNAASRSTTPAPTVAASAPRTLDSDDERIDMTIEVHAPARAATVVTAAR
ncbi:MAG: hypothetical protein U1F43_14640 [Myxococcota bacterium]